MMDEQRLKDAENSIGLIDCPDCEQGRVSREGTLEDGQEYERCETCDGSGMVSRFPDGHALIAEVRRLRERQEDDTVLLGTIAGERDAALAERDHARAALQAVEWTSLDPFFIETPQCPWCLSYEKEGHTTDCARQAALGRGEEE